MLLAELKQRYYTGVPLESGGTSIPGSAAPAVKWLVDSGLVEGTVLDYGAGKYARNADFLRDRGFKTYAFDPFNFNGKEGWEQGAVSSILPKKKFDVAFSCFVLNVVPKKLEAEIIATTEGLAKKTIHITRNRDIFDMVKRALHKQDRTVWPFFVEHFWKGKDEPTITDLTDDLIEDFCKHGVQTIKGFQRIPVLEQYGYELVRNTSGFKIYIKQ